LGSLPAESQPKIARRCTLISLVKLAKPATYAAVAAGKTGTHVRISTNAKAEVRRYLVRRGRLFSSLVVDADLRGCRPADGGGPEFLQRIAGYHAAFCGPGTQGPLSEAGAGCARHV